MANDSTAPKRGTFQFATKWPTIDNGGVEAIDKWLSRHPNAKLVVVDTFVKVRGRAKTRDVYKGDYDAAAPLTALAAKYPQVCILIIHHCSKRSDAEDFFDRFQNSTGLTAAVEGGMELRRTRGSTDCTLEIAHKDIEIDTKHAIKHDPYYGWMLLGDAKTVLLSCEGIVKLIGQLAPDAVIVPYQPPPRSHMDRVQEKRTGIYDTHRKGR
jgi:hypothetical protein